MANIRVDVPYTIKDGAEVVFRSPVDCSLITGLVVYYTAEDGATTSKEFALTDAHGHDVGDIDHLFAENVIVKVILDVTAGMAYVQNADTNAYIERTFAKKKECLSDTAKTLLITILRNGVYSPDQSANITELENALANSGGDKPDVPDIPVDPDEPHTHSYTSVVTTPATCVNDGVRTYTCSCGHSYTAGIKATGHNYEDGVCANCGAPDPDAGTEDKLLYNWDFTKSLTDTVSGNTAVLNGDGVTQDSNGLAIKRNGSTVGHYVSFTDNIHGANRRYEFDVSKYTKTSNSNGYFLHCAQLAGLFYFQNKWQFYTSTNWKYIDTGRSDDGLFSGKTVAVEINGNHFWDLYVDGELVAQSGEAVSKANQTLTIGCTVTSAGCEDMLITGLRVYNMGGA